METLQELLERLAPSLSGVKATAEEAFPKEFENDPIVKKVWDLYAVAYEVQQYRGPLGATMLSDYRYNDRLPDLSMEAHLQSIQELQSLLAEAEKIDAEAVPASQRQNFLFLKEMLELELLREKLPSSRLIPLSHLFGLHTFFPQLGQFHPLSSKEDGGTFMKRMHAFPKLIEQIIAAFQEGVKEGYTLPVFSIEQIIVQVNDQLVPVDELSLYAAVKDKLAAVNINDEDFRLVLTDEVQPAYARLKEFLQNEYIHHARTTDGISSFPLAKEVYDKELRYYSSLPYSSEKIHQMGLSEVARIKQEMEGIKAQVGFNGTLSEFMDHLKEEPKFVPPSGEYIVEEYKRILKLAEDRVKPFFGLMPKASYDVKAIEPFREKSAPPAHYFPPARDGSRPGLFYANTYKHETRPTYVMESIALHEAIPGHHFQIAIAQELPGLPRCRTLTQGFTTGYIEGWGLYTERLGLELGFYTDPYQNFGRLVTEMMRAVRLVVDTGIHSMGWTREKALEYFMANSAMGDTDARNEVDRYCVFPGQAVSYKCGDIKIWDLRKFAENALGDLFKVSEFHDVVLGVASVPLPILETTIHEWVKRKQQDSA